MADEATEELQQALRTRRAFALAAERAGDLFELLYTSADPSAARARLVQEWGLDEAQAETIMNIPSSA